MIQLHTSSVERRDVSPVCVCGLRQRRKISLESSSWVDHTGQLTSRNYLWVDGGVCCASQLPAPERHPDLIKSVWLIKWCVNEDQNKSWTTSIPCSEKMFLHKVQH